jgi:archaellum component FlaF (FlaF/FlaG flagellin family)
MKKTILIGILLACIIASVAIYGAWAQGGSLLGVSAGDNFTYSFVVSWSSTDPNVVVPQEFSNMNQTLSIHFNVTNVGGTMVNLNITTTMKDGTQNSESGYVEVSRGGFVGAPLYIIGANLTAGDQAYPQSDPVAVKAGAAAESFKINETVTRTYLGTERTVNHYTYSFVNMTTGDQADKNVYYDKTSGLLMEMTLQFYSASSGETDSEHWKITQLNSAESTPSDGGNDQTDGTTDSLPAWIMPAVIIVVVVVVVALVVALLFRIRGKKQTPPEMSPPSPPQAPV